MTTRKSPGDFTGRQSEAATEAAQEELRARKDQIAMAQQSEMEIVTTDVFDPADGKSLGTVEQVEMEIMHSPQGVKTEDKVVIRVIEDIPDMVFGIGNHYSFKAGQKYRVDKHLADHLDQCGYLLGRM
jgi:hypothetical protein